MCSSAISPCPAWMAIEVIRTIRRCPSVNGHHSLAIALTALASESDRQAVLEAGFDDHIVKPFTFPDLLRAVSRSACWRAFAPKT